MKVSLWQIYISFLRIGAVLIGGGYAMLPLLEREIVERRQWATSHEMTDYFALAQFLPGVIAINTAMLVGQRLRGFWGILCAAVGTVSVPFVVILVYAMAFDVLADAAWLAAAMRGIRPAVAGMMLGMAWRMAYRGMAAPFGGAIILAVSGLVLFALCPAWVIIVGGVVVGVAWHGIALVCMRKR